MTDSTPPSGSDPRADGTTDPFANAAVPDARSLRGLAHPLRLRILSLLQKRGPATGKAVSERLGVTSASASYHLRQLLAYGFIEEASELGSSRERWWRAPHRGFRLPEELDTEAPELSTAVRMALAARWAEDLGDAVQVWSAQPEGWREAQVMSERRTRLTLDELAALREEVRAVLDRYARDVEEDVPGGRVVTTHFAAFASPDPDDEPPRDPA
ncbi:helix-turn-helix domain-containing protein [Nocardiopsis sp. NRRL B-16309]|uniref:helix-turn-helix domain-containing protein n=1 Tax=Nocardiopsis sp. NRRL B-16309 TaxID=1519494 RepID=UPI0006AF1F06|nr:helix-turn-helix domain-containing protein [Nocardiopsis sp. NRRL B-16309]KOX16464.1 ArsR family transcriptional regulator [Nocardiopsis sp. NRRL B-16309]